VLLIVGFLGRPLVQQGLQCDAPPLAVMLAQPAHGDANGVCVIVAAQWQHGRAGVADGICHGDISGFELQAFFTFSPAERARLEARRGDSHKLGLALHIGLLRMT